MPLVFLAPCSISGEPFPLVEKSLYAFRVIALRRQAITLLEHGNCGIVLECIEGHGKF
jgi:hypothetical protein